MTDSQDSRDRFYPRGRQAHYDMIADPDRWPMWPRLALKRHPTRQGEPYFGFPDLGFIQEDNSPKLKPLRVWKGNITQRITDDLPCEDFETIDALLDAGWMVD